MWKNGDLVFEGHRIPIVEDENILEMDGGNGYTTM